MQAQETKLHRDLAYAPRLQMFQLTQAPCASGLPMRTDLQQGLDWPSSTQDPNPDTGVDFKMEAEEGLQEVGRIPTSENTDS